MFQYPYGDSQQLNLDWLIEQWQETKASIDGSLQGEIDRVEAAITDLLTARDQAVAAQTAAETAATSASGYAGTASGAASTATAQAAAAAASAALAGNHASNAQTSETNAGLQATAAGNSASAAAVSEGNARNSELAAAASSSAAAGNALYAEGMAKGTQNGTPVTSGSPYYENNAAYWAGEAQSYDNDAAAAADYAEAMAKGTVNGTPVASGEPGYEDNAEYYKDQAAAQAAAAAASAASADGAAAQAMIAPLEASSTASAAHAAGTYFRLNGVLYMATQDIAAGATITPGTNCSVAVIGNDLSKLQNNVDEISELNRNLWTGNATESFTTSKAVALGKTYPIGTYTLSAICTSSDTDVTVCRASFGGKSIDLTRGTRKSGTVTVTSAFSSITLFAAQNTTTSTGDSATWADIQLEYGQIATPYIAHGLTAIDEDARYKVNKIRKYVSTTGNDNNDGNTGLTPYRTITKALTEIADEIYISAGTYVENGWGELNNYRYQSLKIIGRNVIIQPSSTGFELRYVNVEFVGLEFDLTNSTYSGSYAFNLLNCTGKVTDCVVHHAKGAGGFRFDGSKITFIRCVAHDNTVDGFNGHTVVTGYETECTFIDCVAYNNGDDGLSIHEHGKLYVVGGEFYGNTEAGIAPAVFCTFEIMNAHCHHNETGIEPVNDNLGGANPAIGRVIGCILENNSTYGLSAQNYTVLALANGYANNTSGATHQGTGATITEYTVT